LHYEGSFAAVVFVIIGALLLLGNLGVFSINFKEILSIWWPAILILVGLGLFFTPRDK
jgi:predicted membrane protein